MINKKVIIFDLDNTIYPAVSISNVVFKELYELIGTSEVHFNNIEKIKEASQRKPFQVVAKEFGFSDSLVNEGLKLLSNLEYKGPIQAFEDYYLTKEIGILKFLVTTGFTKLQWSKINQLNLTADFEEIIVVDPSKSTLTKKDVFKTILEKYNINNTEALVIGDDIHSEIKAAKELDIDSIVYDYTSKLELPDEYIVVNNFKNIFKYL